MDECRTIPEQTTGTAGAQGRPDLLAGQAFPPLPRQERSRLKRDALLDAALALFAERGFEATMVEDIARRAGVAVGSFYQHFHSKRQVLLVLMDRLLDELAGLDLRVDARDVRASVAGLVRRGLRVDWVYAGAYRAWREASLRDQDLHALNRQLEAWTTRQLAGVLGALTQVAGARHGVDVETTAGVLTLLFWRLAEAPAENAEALVETVTHLLYHALFADDDPRGMGREAP